MKKILILVLVANGGIKELHQKHFLQLFHIYLMK